MTCWGHLRCFYSQIDEDWWAEKAKSLLSVLKTLLFHLVSLALTRGDVSFFGDDSEFYLVLNSRHVWSQPCDWLTREQRRVRPQRAAWIKHPPSLKLSELVRVNNYSAERRLKPDKWNPWRLVLFISSLFLSSFYFIGWNLLKNWWDSDSVRNMLYFICHVTLLWIISAALWRFF